MTPVKLRLNLSVQHYAYQLNISCLTVCCIFLYGWMTNHVLCYCSWTMKTYGLPQSVELPYCLLTRVNRSMPAIIAISSGTASVQKVQVAQHWWRGSLLHTHSCVPWLYISNAVTMKSTKVQTLRALPRTWLRHVPVRARASLR